MNKLLEAIQLSNEIEEAVQEYDWDRVSNLDEIRQRAIISYYGEETDIDVELTEKLKQINDSIRDQMIEIQRKTRSQQIGVKHGKKVTRAYQDNQS